MYLFHTLGMGDHAYRYVLFSSWEALLSSRAHDDIIIIAA